MDLPDGDAPAFRARWPSGDREYCYPSDQAIRTGLVVGLELFGAFDLAMPAPIAAEVAMVIPSRPNPIFASTLAFGSNVESYGYGTYPEHPGGTFSWVRVHYMGELQGQGGFETLAEAVADGQYQGRVDLIPSRAVALGTRKFMTYIGDPVSLPVPVEILTLHGKWVDDAEHAWCRKRQRGGS